MAEKLPRLVVAGLAGDTGKSLVTLGLAKALRSRNLSVAPFKKGPDFIDAAWLGVAAQKPGRNLDTYLMPEVAIKASVAQAAKSADVAIIEGNRGLYDGFDEEGTHSTATLAKLIGAPVVLVIDVTKSTRTVAALVMGCMAMDPELDIRGVILNRVGTSRQEEIIRKSLKICSGVEVLGAIPRLKDQKLPSRYLGLVTVSERSGSVEVVDSLGEIISKHVDLDVLLKIAGQAKELEYFEPARSNPPKDRPPVKIGILRDKAFSFYYPENISALEEEGAEIVPISPTTDTILPEIECLYAGGGFPEIYAKELADNRAVKEALLKQINDGLPVWAECGGLMYLSKSLLKDGNNYPMVGALGVDIEVLKKPQGHGYVSAEVDQPNLFIREGTQLRGHEFHYSRIKGDAKDLDTVFGLQRGEGVGNKRDGIKSKNIVASYTHLHALGEPAWAKGLVEAACAGRMQ